MSFFFIKDNAERTDPTVHVSKLCTRCVQHVLIIQGSRTQDHHYHLSDSIIFLTLSSSILNRNWSVKLNTEQKVHHMRTNAHNCRQRKWEICTNQAEHWPISLKKRTRSTMLYSSILCNYSLSHELCILFLEASMRVESIKNETGRLRIHEFSSAEKSSSQGRIV